MERYPLDNSLRTGARRNNRILTAVVTAWTVAATIFISPLSADPRLDDATAVYFRGLRERRLFRLAETYCQHRLTHDELSSDQRAAYSIELARTLTDHAQYVAEAERGELWNQAHGVIDRFLETDGDNLRRDHVVLEGALVFAAIGEWHCWQAELEPEDPRAAGLAVDELRTALDRLRTLERRLGEATQRGNAQPPADEQRALQERVREHSGVVNLNLARVLPADAPARKVALQEAQRLLKLVAEPAENGDGWPARLGLLAAARLAGDPGRALRDSLALAGRSPPRDVGDRLLAERVRALAALERFDEATRALDERDDGAVAPSGELMWLAVHVPFESWRRDGLIPSGADSTDDLLALLERRTARLRRDLGGFWAWRAELLLAQARDAERYGPELAVLVRRAQAAFQNGRSGDAATLYGQAAAAARRAQRDDLAFQLGYTRGSIEVQAEDFGLAASDLMELVSQAADHPQAPAAHLLAAYALGRLYDAKPTKSRREEYTEALEEHRRRFSDPATAGEATWMLAELHERRGQLTLALKLYQQIPWEHARGGAAAAALARCYEKILSRLRELGQPTDAWEREAIATLQAVFPSAADPTARLDAHQCEAAVRFARMLLSRRPPGYAAADRWLLRVLASVGPPEGHTDAAPQDPLFAARTQAFQLRIISLAGQGEFQQAQQQLELASDANPPELLRVLEGLAPLSATDQQDPLHDLGHLQLHAALRLNEHRELLAPAERRRLDECLAQGYRATGKPQRAAEIYGALVRDFPRDARLLETYAALLASLGDNASLQQALAAWKNLETLHPAGSEQWLSARCELCRCLFGLEQSAEACKLLLVTRLLYPELGGEKLHARYVELESRCDRKRPK
ncbi:MAG: hypothetical protein ACT4QC_14915 [Planctomycetaceae bacterium]